MNTRAGIIIGVLAALLVTAAVVTLMRSSGSVQASVNCVAPLGLYETGFDDCVKGIVKHRHDLEVTTDRDDQRGGTVTVTVGGLGSLEQGADLRGWTVQDARFRLYIWAGSNYKNQGQTARPGQPVVFEDVPRGGYVSYYVEVLLSPPSGALGARSVTIFVSGKRSHTFPMPVQPTPTPEPTSTPVPRAEIESLRVIDRGQQSPSIHHYLLEWTTSDGREPDRYRVAAVQLHADCSRHTFYHQGVNANFPNWTYSDTDYKSYLHVEAGVGIRWEYRVTPIFLTRSSVGQGMDAGEESDSVFNHSACGSQSIGNPNPQQSPPSNSPATGQPTISGTAESGQTLTASTAGIGDPNGLSNAQYEFQWSRDDGVTETDISGATSSTYTVQDGDVGYQLSVTVSFTDDDGNQESLKSEEVRVQSPQPLYGGFDQDTVPDNHDGSTAFTFQIHFSEEPALSYVNVRDHVLTVTGGTVISAKRTKPGSETPNKRWTITVEPSGNGDVTVELPPTTDCEDDGAVCTSGDKMLSNNSNITVSGPN